MARGPLYERWKSARQVGAATPTLRVTVTRGLIDKKHQKFEFLGGGTEQPFTVVDGRNNEPWQGFWRATGEPKELPNVLSVKRTKDFTQKGTGSAVVEVENVIFKAITGVGGIYHAIMRGYLSPWLGATLITRARIPSWVENEWFEVLDNGYKIDVFEGYGDQSVRTFTGLIEDSDLEAHPDRITITARDFGVLFTDQRVMGWNKPPEIKAPLQIADRERTLGIKAVGYRAQASSTAPGRPVQNILNPGNATSWVSKGHATSAAVEWVEILLPDGYYESVYLDLPYDGQAVYIAVFAGTGSHWNGSAVSGFVNGGKGSVPETGVLFTNSWGSSSSGGARRALNGAFEARNESAVRIYLRNLPYRSEWGDHRAGVRRLAGMMSGTNAKPLNGEPAKHARHWVLVDDMSDIAKAVFMWAGFHEWEVEEMGWSPRFPMAWSMEKFFSDMLSDIEAQANWLFYLEGPTPGKEASLGVPCFVHNRATDPAPSEMLEVRDSDLLESVKAKIDLSNLPYIIRYRGNVSPSGSVADGDPVKRFGAEYFPPWSGAGPDITESGRTAGVRRHELTVDTNLHSDEECMFAAILAAVQYALTAYTAEVQVSGYPLELNQQISIVDSTTAINSRMWVASITSEHTTGANGQWKMTVGGALLDGIDMQQLKSDLTEWKAIVQTIRALKSEIAGVVRA